MNAVPSEAAARMGEEKPVVDVGDHPTCSCSSQKPLRRVIPVWLIIVMFFCAILPGIVALYGHNRLLACGSCGRIQWRF